MARASEAPRLRVAVAWSARPGQACEVGVELPGGASVIDAIRASGAMTGVDAIDVSTQAVGIWGRAVGLDAPLAEGDRVEIYRPLQMDPKEARRRRALPRRPVPPTSGNRTR